MKRIRRKLALNKQTAVILVFLPKSKIDKKNLFKSQLILLFDLSI